MTRFSATEHSYGAKIDSTEYNKSLLNEIIQEQSEGITGAGLLETNKKRKERSQNSEN